MTAAIVILSAALAAAALLVLVITFRTMRLRRNVPNISPDTAEYPDPAVMARHLAEAIRFPTVSHADAAQTDWDAFRRLRSWLADTYPAVRSRLESWVVGGYTLIFRWSGSDPSLEPVLLTAHQDVVPAGDPQKWEHPPFAGTISEEGYLWGRGALDIKIQMIALLETIEFLLIRDYRPKRDIWVCFGHDEEVGGRNGAELAAGFFKDRGISFAWMLDEGGAVADGVVPGLEVPFAAVGVAEKGYLDIEISSLQSGGHSSTPPSRTALGRVARAVARVEQRQFPMALTPVPEMMFRKIGPYLPILSRVVIANLWLFRPLFLKIAGSGDTARAMFRTTVAPTMASGSSASNVLPAEARAVLNIRLLTGTSSRASVERISRIIADPQVDITPLLVNEPSRVSSSEGGPFRLLEQTIQQIFPGAVTAPYLMAGGTDAVKYEDVCRDILRFTPVHIDSGELKRMHAFNERISLKNIELAGRFFTQLLVNTDHQFRSE